MYSFSSFCAFKTKVMRDIVKRANPVEYRNVYISLQSIREYPNMVGEHRIRE